MSQSLKWLVIEYFLVYNFAVHLKKNSWARIVGPKSAGPRTVGTQTAGPRKLGPGPICPQKTDSWALDSWAPGQLGPSQLGPGQMGPTQLGPRQLAPDSWAPDCWALDNWVFHTKIRIGSRMLNCTHILEIVPSPLRARQGPKTTIQLDNSPKCLAQKSG